MHSGEEKRMKERKEGCPLCGVCEREPENVLYEDEHFAIVRTKKLKGHHERVMLILKRHLEDIPPNISYDFSWVTKTPAIRQRLKEIFNYTYKAIVMGKYARARSLAPLYNRSGVAL